MPKYEYDHYIWDKTNDEVFSVYFGEIAERGWELVSTATDMDESNFIHLFVRRKK